MFNKKRYLTRGVRDEIPFEIQMALWAIISARHADGEELDYLQVFKLSSKGSMLQIINSQEVPPYTKELVIPLECAPDTPIETRVWVIDSGEYSTMLLPEEY